MRTHTAKLAQLVVMTAASSNEALACECRILDRDRAHKDSTHIILGEVVKVEAVETPRNGDGRIEYVATLKPVETYRGKPEVEVRVKFLVNPQVIGCDPSMKIGERYVILRKERYALIYDSLCSERIRPAVPRVVEYMRNLP